MGNRLINKQVFDFDDQKPILSVHHSIEIYRGLNNKFESLEVY